MDLRPLGETQIAVSALGLGSAKFGRNTALAYPRGFALPTDAQLTELLHQARGAGINLIDTAPAYGVSEARIGALLPGNRTDWVIVTKVGETFSRGVSRHDFSARHTRMSVQRSLRRLRTDYLDLVLVHCPDADLAALQHSDCLATLLQLRQQGVIRAFGASTKTQAGTRYALGCCDVVMITAAPDDAGDRACLETAARANRGVLIKKALASGHASAGQMDERLRWLGAQAAVSCVVVGTIDPEHLRTHCASIASGPGREPADQPPRQTSHG